MGSVKRSLLQELSKEQLVERILQLESRLGSAPEPGAKRAQRPMPWSKFSFRPVVFQVLYLGWPYHGVAYQPPSTNSLGNTISTVEGEFFNACRRVRILLHDSVEDCNFSRSGRTDAGVSAFCQMFGMRVRSRLAENVLQQNPMQTDGELDYLSMLNGSLPATIRVLRWAPMPICSRKSARFDDGAQVATLLANEQFDSGAPSTNSSVEPNQTEKSLSSNVATQWDARFSCSSRQYRYFFLANRTLDIAAMNTAAGFLVGEHDFRFFCRLDENSKSSPTPKNYKRLIERAEITRLASGQPLSYDIYELEVKGSGFLYNQIRCIMGVLYSVGLRREQPEVVNSMLEIAANPKYATIPKPPYEIASESGLILWRCEYEHEFAIKNWVHASNPLRQLTGPLMAELNLYESRVSIIKSALHELHHSGEFGVDAESFENGTAVISYGRSHQSIADYLQEQTNQVEPQPVLKSPLS